jgi:hypothetical protein
MMMVLVRDRVFVRQGLLQILVEEAKLAMIVVSGEI